LKTEIRLSAHLDSEIPEFLTGLMKRGGGGGTSNDRHRHGERRKSTPDSRSVPKASTIWTEKTEGFPVRLTLFPFPHSFLNLPQGPAGAF
jgi:hypothetical protein